MTTRELVHAASGSPVVLVSAFVLPPILAWLCGRGHGPGNGSRSPWKYVYSVLVYLVCVTGMFSSVLTGYALFFTRENLMDADLLVYFLPIVSMIVTLVFIRKNVSFNDVPGFDRLSGLMAVLGCSFILALAISKTRIFLFFGGSFERLLALGLGIFALIKWGLYMLFRGKDEPKQEPPQLPGSA